MTSRTQSRTRSNSPSSSMTSVATRFRSQCAPSLPLRQRSSVISYLTLQVRRSAISESRLQVTQLQTWISHFLEQNKCMTASDAGQNILIGRVRNHDRCSNYSRLEYCMALLLPDTESRSKPGEARLVHGQEQTAKSVGSTHEFA